MVIPPAYRHERRAKGIVLVVMVALPMKKRLAAMTILTQWLRSALFRKSILSADLGAQHRGHAADGFGNFAHCDAPETQNETLT